MTDSERFWDRLARRYAARPVSDAAAYEKTLERVRAHLSPGDRVLEFGCGTGTTALILAPHVAHVTASDISGAMIAIAREKAAAQAVANAEFVKGTLFDTKPAGGGLDAVMGFNILHLLDDLPAAIGHAGTLLKPGGLFITKTACIGHMNPLLRIVLPALRVLGLAPRVSFLTVDVLETAIRGAGFEIVETGLYPAKSHSRFVVARKVSGRPQNRDETDPTSNI